MSRRWSGLGALVLIVAAFLALPVALPRAPVSPVLFDRNGEMLCARVADDEQWRFPSSGTLPERWVAAVIASEDRRFRHHPGVDPVAVARAAAENLAAGSVRSGASTITMQVVRLARNNPPRTWTEKAVEAVLALRLEVATSKDAILRAYAASAPFGGNLVGLDAASWRLFRRAPGDLSWAEAATLAVLPNSPSQVHAGRDREGLTARRDRLLTHLAAQGHIDPGALATALAEPVPHAPRPAPCSAPHALAHAPADGTRTTLDARLQEHAASRLDRAVAALAGSGIHNAAALVVDLPSGEVRAWVGNRTPGPQGTHGEHVDVVHAPRSTGSTLKPFLYAAMLEAGELLPHQLVADVPTRFGGFAPENFDQRYDGAIPAASALARSRNVPAVWMLRDHTVDRFAARLRRLGLTTLFRPASDYGLSLIVGGAEATLWDLVGAYRDLALSAQSTDGRIGPPLHWVSGAAPAGAREAPFDAGAAWLTLEAMLEVHRPGLDASWRDLRGSDAVAWKTGTSFGFRDALAIGVTPRTAIGVWVGNADGEGRPGLTGQLAAAPLLFDLFERAERGPWFPAPDDALISVDVCALSGLPAGPHCTQRHRERVPRLATQAAPCAACRAIHCDAGCTERLHVGCASLDEIHTEDWFALPPGQERWYRARHPSYRPLPPWRKGCAPPEAGPVAFTSPAPGTVLFVPTELDGRRGRALIEATHSDPEAVLYWHLDDAFLGATTAPHRFALDPEPGPHRVVVVDASGHRADLPVEVRR
jgi:penicillin-binding protein 1C